MKISFDQCFHGLPAGGERESIADSKYCDMCSTVSLFVKFRKNDMSEKTLKLLRRYSLSSCALALKIDRQTG